MKGDTAMKKTAVIAILLAPFPAQATGMYSCDPIAPEDWLTKAEITEKAEAEGWKVRRMKKDGGCWEVYATMPDGKRVEAYFHPESGEVLLINQRGKILYRKDG